MRTGGKILLGCVATPFVLLLLFALLFLVFRAMPLPESAPTQAAQEPSGSVTLQQLEAEGLAVGAPEAPPGKAVSVTIWLEEGTFHVKPAPEGEGFRVEGQYDKSMYDLKHEITRDRSGTASFSLSFRPRYSMLRRILSAGFLHMDDETNKITVYVPRGLPMELNLKSYKGETNLDLTGLSLAKMDLDLGMGEHNMVVNEPNPLEMSALKVNQSMGEMELHGLANLRAGDITIWGQMGELCLDLGESLLRDTKMYARMRMGEMSIGIPTDARVQASSSMFLGETEGNPNRAEGAHRLELDVSSSMGELTYHDSHQLSDPL
ncbi:MAG: hypothetical protein ACREAA_16480 [Candidatus Polarisedimenticolia bacterium]